MSLPDAGEPGHAHDPRAPRSPGRRRATPPRRRASRTPLGYAGLPSRILLGLLALCAVLAVVAVVLLWPSRSTLHALQDKAQFATPGTVWVHARIDDETGTGAHVTLKDGPDAGQHVTISLPTPDLHSSLGDGDTVVLARTPGSGGSAATYSFFSVQRSTSLWLLVGLFVVVLVAVARWRGVMALVGLAVAGAILWWFAVPALLVGHHPVLVAVAGSTLILFVVLYTTHGLRSTTSAALAGTLGGIAITVGVASWSVHDSSLNGVTGDAGGTLSGYVSSLPFPALLVAAVVIAGLGVLNDVTITQASAVYELRAASPEMSRLDLFRSAMRIGRDHIASTVYTIVFAYAGTALLTLMIIQLYDMPMRILIGTEDLAEEVVRTLVSAVGLILAVPLTTAIATLVADGSEPAHAHHHHH